MCLASDQTTTVHFDADVMLPKSTIAKKKATSVMLIGRFYSSVKSLHEYLETSKHHNIFSKGLKDL